MIENFHTLLFLQMIKDIQKLSQEKKSQTSYKTYQKNFGYLNNDSHEEYR